MFNSFEGGSDQGVAKSKPAERLVVSERPQEAPIPMKAKSPQYPAAIARPEAAFAYPTSSPIGLDCCAGRGGGPRDPLMKRWNQ